MYKYTENIKINNHDENLKLIIMHMICLNKWILDNRTYLLKHNLITKEILNYTNHKLNYEIKVVVESINDIINNFDIDDNMITGNYINNFVASKLQFLILYV